MAGKLFWVHSPTRITLSPEARELCKLHNMSERAMAKHLLAQHRAEGGEVYDETYDYDDAERRRNERRRDYLPYAPEVNVEDRREERYDPVYSSADIAGQLGAATYSPRQTLEFQGRAQSTPLGREAGYEDIGSHTSHKRSLRESSPSPTDYYRTNPVDYLLHQAEFNRLSPDLFNYK